MSETTNSSEVIYYVHNGPNKDRPICSFYNMVGHIADICYKKYGFPPGFTPKGKSYDRFQKPKVAAQVTLSPNNFEGLIGNMTKDEIQQLIALFM